MKERMHWGEWMAIVGLLLVFAATALPLFMVSPDIYRWIYGAGAILVTAGKALRPCPLPENIRVRRLCRIEVWGGLMFVAGTFFMFYYPYGNTDWIAFTLAGGAIEVYASLMISRALKNG
ncbi:MAG: hypothetical protein J1E38_07065 [Paramuribaculum sp.]|nr:hypothetical protein [Paramuribaculum sp.]